MSHDLLSRYLETVEAAVRRLKNAHVELYEEEILAQERVNLPIRVRFAGGHLLELNEAVVLAGEPKQGLTTLGYRYHFQDKLRNVVFRYDNTPHFPAIKTFPDHKHAGDGVVASRQPTISEVVEEVERFFQLG